MKHFGKIAPAACVVAALSVSCAQDEADLYETARTLDKAYLAGSGGDAGSCPNPGFCADTGNHGDTADAYNPSCNPQACDDGDKSTIDECAPDGVTCLHTFDRYYTERRCEWGKFCCPSKMYGEACGQVGTCRSHLCEDLDEATVDICQDDGDTCWHHFDKRKEGKDCRFSPPSDHCCDDGRFHADCFFQYRRFCPPSFQDYCMDGDPTTRDFCEHFAFYPGWYGAPQSWECRWEFMGPEGAACNNGKYCCDLDHTSHLDCDSAAEDYWGALATAVLPALEKGFAVWRSSAQIYSGRIIAIALIVEGNSVWGAKHAFSSELFDVIGEGPNRWKITEAISGAVRAGLEKYERSFRVPGFPAFPAFAAFPGPNAPPMPGHLPMAATLGDLTGLTPAGLKSGIMDRLGDLKDSPGAETAAQTIAHAVSVGFLAWRTTGNAFVLGAGPVPTFAPPYVPVGPVVNGHLLQTAVFATTANITITAPPTP